MTMSPERNPFTPGAGYAPPYLAGRETVLHTFERHIDRASRLPKHFLLTGLRGTGKTVLLREFQEICARAGWVCARRELDETAADTGVLLRMVAADLARVAAGASLGVRLRQVGREVVEALKPKDIQAWGVRYSPAYAKVLETPDRDQLVALLHQVLAVLRHDHTGLVLMYDEFHEVWDGRYRGQAPLATLLGAIKEVQLASQPVVLVACGLPPLLPQLLKSRSYLERDIAVQRIDNLAAADAAAAITRPLATTSVRFSPRLVDEIVRGTRGYPFFLQHYCSFLLDSAPDCREFDLSIYDLLRPLLLEGLDESFFLGRFTKLPPAERALLFAIARAGERVRLTDIPWAGPRNILRTLAGRLVERGHLYRPSQSGEVAFALPLYREFLLRYESGRAGA